MNASSPYSRWRCTYSAYPPPTPWYLPSCLKLASSFSPTTLRGTWIQIPVCTAMTCYFLPLKPLRYMVCVVLAHFFLRVMVVFSVFYCKECACLLVFYSYKIIIWMYMNRRVVLTLCFTHQLLHRYIYSPTYYTILCYTILY